MTLSRYHVVFRVHALQRMFERGVNETDVRHVLQAGSTIESYPDDTPYPSRLVLGWCGSRPVHVVAADNAAEQEIVIITVYEPDSTMWESGFTKRKRP